jgi:hypothetical protein
MCFAEVQRRVVPFGLVGFHVKILYGLGGNLGEDCVRLQLAGDHINRILRHVFLI